MFTRIASIVNHSCNPNASSVTTNGTTQLLFATRCIPKGEEISELYQVSSIVTLYSENLFFHVASLQRVIMATQLRQTDRKSWRGCFILNVSVWLAQMTIQQSLTCLKLIAQKTHVLTPLLQLARNSGWRWTMLIKKWMRSCSTSYKSLTSMAW